MLSVYSRLRVLLQLDEYFRSERERRVQQLKQRLAAEEEAAVARMVEKHSQEMLRLISDKVRAVAALGLLRCLFYRGYVRLMPGVAGLVTCFFAFGYLLLFGSSRPTATRVCR